MPSRFVSVLMGLFFSLVPALVIGALVSFFDPVPGILAGVATFGFGLSMYFNGSGGNGTE